MEDKTIRVFNVNEKAPPTRKFEIKKCWITLSNSDVSKRGRKAA